MFQIAMKRWLHPITYQKLDPQTIDFKGFDEHGGKSSLRQIVTADYQSQLRIERDKVREMGSRGKDASA